MVSFATELALRGLDAVTFNFFYMEHSRGGPDKADKLEACYRAVIDTARRKRCDLVLMASHGRRGVAGLLLGSETQKVLTHSRIPVLVYR